MRTVSPQLMGIEGTLRAIRNARTLSAPESSKAGGEDVPFTGSLTETLWSKKRSSSVNRQRLARAGPVVPRGIDPVSALSELPGTPPGFGRDPERNPRLRYHLIS